MYRLFSFIKRYNTFFFFILLQIFAISLLLSYNSYHQSAFFSTFQETSGFLHDKYQNVSYFLNLRKLNDSLLKENARLHESLYSQRQYMKRSAKGFDTNEAYSYVFKRAYVINNSIHKRNNYFTMNIGRTDSVHKGMAVVSTSGIVGIVRNVSKNYALVLSILNTDFHVSARISELNELGSVSWDGDNIKKIILKDIPSHVKLEKGYTVVVGPYSKYFPENYPIGIIESFNLDETGSFYKVVVMLNASMRNLSAVYVIDKLGVQEQEQLEKEETE